MKTTIKMFSALVLSATFGAGCGGQQNVDDNGLPIDVESQEQAVISNRCMVTSATSNVQTGYCYLGGNAAYRPTMCAVGAAIGTPTYAGTWGGNPAYVNQLGCK